MCRRWINPTGESAPLDAVSGFAAECMASTLWTPADVVKQRLQVTTTKPGELTVKDAVSAAIASGGGVHGLWRGYVAGLAVWGPFAAMYFASYEAFKARLVGADEASAGDNMVAGVSALVERFDIGSYSDFSAK